jgi:hypothetical protein
MRHEQDKQFKFKPKLSQNKNYQINTPFEERQKEHLEKVKEKKQAIIDSENQKENGYFQPKLIANGKRVPIK